MTPTNAMVMRFIAEDAGDGSIVEAAIDDFAADDLGPVSCNAVPSSYCLTSPNSVGTGAVISTTGSQSVAANAFGLLATGAPANTPGLFYYGQTQGQFAFADGFRCVTGAQVFRLPILTTDAAGTASTLVDITNPPRALGQISANQSWNFQFWYADPAGPGGSGSNLSDAVEVLFCN